MTNTDTQAQTAQILYTMMHMLNRIETAQLESIMHQRQNVFTFIEQDTKIHMYLPHAHDLIESMILKTHTFFEANILRAVSNLIDKNKTVLDIGANIGNHTVYFSKILNCGKVVAFEPQKTMQEMFEKNMELNNITNVVLNKFPLSDRVHKMSIDVSRFDQTNYGGTTFMISDDGAYESKSLDSLCIEDVGFVKMDVEEHELNVLKGAKELFTNQHPPLWIEIHSGNPTEKETLQLLESYGYKCTAKFSEMDYLFMHA